MVCVPSGNFGNITAGLFGKRMGLPVKRFIAANNRNDIFYQYLKTGEYCPRPSVATIANAMDVGDPSNFARVLDLYEAVMMPLLLKSAVKPIPMNRYVKRCRRFMKKQVICSILTVHADTVRWQRN